MSASAPDGSLPRRKRWSFRLLAILLSLLMCFFCLEIGFRIWGPDYHRVFMGGSHETAIQVGDCMLLMGASEYYSNPRGYFDIWREEHGQTIYGVELCAVGPPWRRIPHSVAKPEDVQAFLAREDEVLVLGDSFTMGKGVRYEDTYARKLEGLLAQEGNSVTIGNAGVVAFDLEEVCDAYLEYSAQRYYPLVIYGFVLNDFGLPGRERIIGSDYIDTNNGEDLDNAWRRHLASVNFVLGCLDNIRLDRMTKQAYLQAFSGQNARDKFELLERLAGRIQSEGSEFVIVLFPLLHDFHDYPFQEIHDKINGFCQENDILLLDLLPAYSRHAAESLWVHPTDYHPNEIGHQIAAEEIHSFLHKHGLLEAVAEARRTNTNTNPKQIEGVRESDTR